MKKQGGTIQKKIIEKSTKTENLKINKIKNDNEQRAELKDNETFFTQKFFV